MSTRSCLYFFGKDFEGEDYSTRIYRHCDGYPSSNLSDLATAVENGGRGASVSADRFAGVFIDATAGSAKPDAAGGQDEFNSILPREILSDQDDLEWVYLIDTENRSVNVYGKTFGYSGSSAAQIASGVSDPRKEAEEVLPQYVEETQRAVEGALRRLEDSGWSAQRARLPQALVEHCRERLAEERDYREIYGMVPEGYCPMHCDPTKAETFVGPMTHCNSHYALQRVRNKDGAEYWATHEVANLTARPEVGKLASVEYDGAGKGLLDQRFASVEHSKPVAGGPRATERKRDPGMSQGV
jgi:hypothetical protein